MRLKKQPAVLVLQPATTPVSHDHPPDPVLRSLLGVLVGLFGGILLAVVVEIVVYLRAAEADVEQGE
jgi:hypothetical protein